MIVCCLPVSLSVCLPAFLPTCLYLTVCPSVYPTHSLLPSDRRKRVKSEKQTNEARVTLAERSYPLILAMSVVSPLYLVCVVLGGLDHGL